MKLLGELLFILQIVFITLKLAGVVDWSWWLVLAPFLAETGVILFLLVSIALVAIGVLIKDDLGKK